MVYYITKEESKKFEGEGALYHYTSIQTAIEHILPSGRLKLTNVTSAVDPMEGDIQGLSISNFTDANEKLEKQADGISNKVVDYYKSLNQLCFCRNSTIDLQGECCGGFEPIDHFGFIKPRMWDQYGGKYTGVCIAFSRSKLETELSKEYKIKDVKYIDNDSLRANIDSSGVERAELEEGEKLYLERKKKNEIKKLATKHKDYNDENECKVIVSSLSDYNYIDIHKYVEGIFVTHKLNDTYVDILTKNTKDYNVPIYKVSIKRTGSSIEPLNYMKDLLKEQIELNK